MKTTKNIALVGIGIALFVVLSLCLQVPVFENYYLCLGYIVMSVYCYSIGIVSGTIVGTLGTILYCFLIGGLRGMPGWAIGNIAIGIIIGATFLLTKKIKSTTLSIAIAVIGIVFANTIGILGIKSLTEVILYSQPFVVRVVSNTTAFVADIVVLIASLPICKLLHKQIIKTNIHTY